MLTSIIRSQSSTFRRSSGECGISPALLMITSMRPQLDRGVDERLDLRGIGDVGGECRRLAVAAELAGQRLDALFRRAPSASRARSRDTAPSLRRARCSRR